MADLDHRIARARFRAWHRGTREADYLIGGFFDRHHPGWDLQAVEWFERLLDQDDVDVMAWAMGTQPVPPAFTGEQMSAMQKLDYVAMP